MTHSSDNSNLRALPAVNTVLERPASQRAIERHGRAVVTRAVRDAIANARSLIVSGNEAAISDADVSARANEIARGSLRPVINATGIIVHTNLGRAPLATEAIAAMNEIASGYSTLEYDLDEGTRGERHGHARDLLVELTGAEDALVVNNNAAAVLLALAALASNPSREVIVSRGELVEIGGGFRIPDVLEQSGARLVEVGTTNRTHPHDYERAITAETALLLKVHRSNFAIVGFTTDVSVRTLRELAKNGLAVVCDAGSGCLDPSLNKDEPTVRSLIDDGADLVLFSGDKLLGGPQAGIVVGRASLVERMRRHPLMRALRPDKLCIAALVATLRLWRDEPSHIPVVRFARVPSKELERRARRMERANVIEVIRTIARFGGGASPLHEIESWGIRVSTDDADALAKRLREESIIGRIEDGALVLDLRCVAAEDDDRLIAALSRE